MRRDEEAEKLSQKITLVCVVHKSQIKVSHCKNFLSFRKVLLKFAQTLYRQGLGQGFRKKNATKT